jgi:predicted DNA-binding transcriptional regulator YafY
MRASRLLSILILLQLRGRLTAAELAAEFEVSDRTIYRDIDALSIAGVAIYGDRGPGGGFALLDGYQTRLTGLAADEAEAMPMIGVMAQAAELGLGQAATTARNKLLAALPDKGRQSADRVSERVHFDPTNWYRGTDPVPHLPAVARAVLDQHGIAMHYRSWSAQRRWHCEPLGLVMKAGEWYLAAQARGKMRIFRLAAMSDVEILPQRFERPARFHLADWWAAEQARFEAELFSDTAILRLSPLGAQRLAALSPRGAAAVRKAQPDRDGWMRASMAIENSDHGAREILGLGAEVAVLSPPDFRDRIRALAAGIAALQHGETALDLSPEM